MYIHGNSSVVIKSDEEDYEWVSFVGLSPQIWVSFDMHIHRNNSVVIKNTERDNGWVFFVGLFSQI